MKQPPKPQLTAKQSGRMAGYRFRPDTFADVARALDKWCKEQDYTYSSWRNHDSIFGRRPADVELEE